MSFPVISFSTRGRKQDVLLTMGGLLSLAARIVNSEPVSSVRINDGDFLVALLEHIALASRTLDETSFANSLFRRAIHKHLNMEQCMRLARSYPLG
jgi:hypothetical protein